MFCHITDFTYNYIKKIYVYNFFIEEENAEKNIKDDLLCKALCCSFVKLVMRKHIFIYI